MSAYVLGLSRELARRGVGVSIVTAAHQDAHSMEPDYGVRVAHLPSSGAGSAAEWVAHAGTFAEEIRAAVGEGCDLIHTHYWASGLAGVEVSRLFGIPHVTTFHTIAAVKELAVVDASPAAEHSTTTTGLASDAAVEPRERHTAERAIAQGADGVVAWTGFEAESLVSMLGAERNRITVAPIGVDTERFRPQDRAEARSRLGIPADEETLLYVGRLDRIKGADVLLRAAGLLVERPQMRVRFVGGEVDADYAEGLRALAADLNIADIISWIGPVPNDELPWHYAAADLVIVPSYSESFSIVAAEAMACGTPVVASNVPGPASFIEDGVSGRLVAAGDAPALACAVQDLLDDGELRQRIGLGALKVARGMTWGASADAVVALYDKVIGLTGGVEFLDSSLRSE